VLATPGHTSDSLSFQLPDAVLTGDTVLGRGTTVVAHPDGVLADYLASLRRLRELGDLAVLPGHGPELPSAGVAAQEYLAHREARLEQVRAAVQAGATDAESVVRTVYADVDPALWPAATLSVRAPAAAPGRAGQGSPGQTARRRAPLSRPRHLSGQPRRCADASSLGRRDLPRCGARVG
jgi:glyoxylase-like metal-dependent hydrolase (beta-lactamase superfamily II)